jgi:hypothetical protein
LREMCDANELIIPVDLGGKLGPPGQSDHGHRHGPPWKGRASPLVPAVKSGARGS